MGTLIRLAADLSSEVMETRRHRTMYSKCSKKNLSTKNTILFQKIKVSKNIPFKQKLKECVARRSILQEVQKENFQVQSK